MSARTSAMLSLPYPNRKQNRKQSREKETRQKEEIDAD